MQERRARLKAILKEQLWIAIQTNGAVSLKDSEDLTTVERDMIIEILQEGEQISEGSLDAASRPADAGVDRLPPGALGTATLG